MDLKNNVTFNYDMYGNVINATYGDSTYRTTIPDYNIITDEDSVMVSRAKQEAQINQYIEVFFRK